jgi:hypothetical protein
MIPEIKEGKQVKKQIKVYGIEAPVFVILTRDGISFKIKGAKGGVHQAWPKIVNSCFTPDNVPSFLAGRPVMYLQYVASQMAKRSIKRQNKKEEKQV